MGIPNLSCILHSVAKNSRYRTNKTSNHCVFNAFVGVLREAIVLVDYWIALDSPRLPLSNACSFAKIRWLLTKLLSFTFWIRFCTLLACYSTDFRLLRLHLLLLFKGFPNMWLVLLYVAFPVSYCVIGFRIKSDKKWPICGPFHPFPFVLYQFGHRHRDQHRWKPIFGHFYVNPSILA